MSRAASRTASKACSNSPGNKENNEQLDYYGQPVKKEVVAIDIR